MTSLSITVVVIASIVTFFVTYLITSLLQTRQLLNAVDKHDEDMRLWIDELEKKMQK